MGNRLRRIFNPSPEVFAEDLKTIKAIHKEVAKEHDCSTCKHIKHINDYPGYYTGEEYECAVGLTCNTILYSVKNCPNWMDRWDSCDNLEKGERNVC